LDRGGRVGAASLLGSASPRLNGRSLKKKPSPALTWQFKPCKKWTIQKSLVTLGAPYGEVYSWDHRKSNICPYCQRSLPRRCKQSKKRRGSIYARYTPQELADWIQQLWREAKIKYHPDRYQNNKAFYTRKFQEVSEAYVKARKILRAKRATFGGEDSPQLSWET